MLWGKLARSNTAEENKTTEQAQYDFIFTEPARCGGNKINPFGTASKFLDTINLKVV